MRQLIRRCGAAWWRSWSSKPAWGSNKSQVGSIPIHLRHSVRHMKFRRVPQPPVHPDLRAPERHEFWPGFIVAVAAALVVFFGAQHLTSVDTTAGATAKETQLVAAFASGGLQYPDHAAAPPPNLAGAANPAELLDRWAKEQANPRRPSWKVRVDASAKTPCPT